MCELMAIAAAIAFTTLYFVARRRGGDASAERTVALAFWGAALMWAVDCAFSFAEEGVLFDLSRDDAKLGALIVAAGLALYAVLRLRARRA